MRLPRPARRGQPRPDRRGALSALASRRGRSAVHDPAGSAGRPGGSCRSSGVDARGAAEDWSDKVITVRPTAVPRVRTPDLVSGTGQVGTVGTHGSPAVA